MIQLQVVPPNQVYSLWDEVSPMIQAALDSGTFCYNTLEQVKLLLVKEMQQLLVIVENDELVGAMVTEFVNYPNERVLFVVEIGGKGIINETVSDQLGEWARFNGATRMCAWADEARARLYRMKAGFTTARHVVEKKL